MTSSERRCDFLEENKVEVPGQVFTPLQLTSDVIDVMWLGEAGTSASPTGL